MMTNTRRSLACGIGVALSLASGAEPAGAQTVADLFDAQTLQEIRLLINSRDVQSLRARYLENTYYPADLIWRGQRVRNAAVRSRGVGSRNPTKPGLRVDFDRYTTGQRFVGLASLVLDNLYQDPAIIRERIAMALFDRMGIPAPRESFCRLYINNEYAGVYAVVEEIEPDFVTRVTGETGGYLFEYHYVMPFHGEDLGDIAPYKPMFEPRSHELEADSVLYTPIRDLFREANIDDATWRDRVERYIGLRPLIAHVAIENFIAENDGLVGYAGTNNFYLYRSAGATLHRLFPWDKDSAFLQIDFPIFQRTEENVLTRRALAFDDLRALYLETLERCARLASEGEWMPGLVTQFASVIDAAAREDTRKLFPNDDFDAGIAFLKDFALKRPAFVLDEIARARLAVR